jgi:23S rRNA (uridine2552-2'-O)-methyltransferase
VLAEGGGFVAKVFQGGAERTVLEALKRHFASVRHAKPPASRKESSELYVVATGFRGGALGGGSTSR